MHPSAHARSAPERPAYIMADGGEVVTYGQLEGRSNQGAQLFRALGLTIGDTVAIWLENHPRFLEIAWAAQRAGLYYTCLSSRLTTEEAEYILRDCGAKVLITSATLGAAPDPIPDSLPSLVRFSVGGARLGFQSYEAARDVLPPTPIEDERAGQDMLYSSGTTGRPKGVRPPFPEPSLLGLNRHAERCRTLYGMTERTIYLCPAPLYHAAPLRWSMAVQRLGGTVVVMERFDAERALALVERQRVTHAQWVPTHFVRMLKLPEDVRRAYDLGSLEVAIHAAAPCPVPIKEAMMAWWGPILWEYYGGTENAGLTIASPQEWLAHPGTVGRAVVGTLRICDPDGEPVPIGVEGEVFFEGGPDFAYHNDAEKTAASRNRHGWRTLGDVGYVDADGYLFLTDRKGFVIISGGVNIYPQEIENVLIGHPDVLDAAVFGVPDEDFGERVVAVVQPLDWAKAGPGLARELEVFARRSLSGVKIPRQFDFRPDLPRQPTGKLNKRELRAEYQPRVVAR